MFGHLLTSLNQLFIDIDSGSLAPSANANFLQKTGSRSLYATKLQFFVLSVTVGGLTGTQQHFTSCNIVFPQLSFQQKQRLCHDKVY